MTTFSYPHHRDEHGLLTGVNRKEPLCIPPHPAGTIAMLCERGHKVTVRQTKGGSLRYRIDGARELLAIEMSNFYARRYGF